jgi:hypothetical protein
VEKGEVREETRLLKKGGVLAHMLRPHVSWKQLRKTGHMKFGNPCLLTGLILHPEIAF